MKQLVIIAILVVLGLVALKMTAKKGEANVWLRVAGVGEAPEAGGVVVRYGISNLPRSLFAGNGEPALGAPVFVVLSEGAPATAERVYLAVPELEPGRVFIRGVITALPPPDPAAPYASRPASYDDYAPGFTIAYGIESYAGRFDAPPAFAQVAITRDGGARIIKFADAI